jgi:hypothetical protein
MGKYFSVLGKAEQAAIRAHVRGDYDALVQKQPSTYAMRHAQADPAGWQEALCELIAGDPERVESIVDEARRTLKKEPGK